MAIVLDQSITNVTAYNLSILGASGTEEAYAAKFTPSYTGELVQVDMPLQKNGNPTDNTYIAIYTNSSDKPDALVTNGTSSDVSSASISGAGEWVTFTFPTNPSLTAATQYWITIERDGARDASNYINSGSCNTEANGRAIKESGTWSAQDANPGAFKTYREVSVGRVIFISD